VASPGQPIGAERWLVYQLVRLWALERLAPDARRPAQRAAARALQRYFAERYLAEAPSSSRGPVCALDLDGVLEGTVLGVPSLTPASAAALRALLRHGFRPVLATGRSLAEVQERCAAYGLAGGVAEYGAVVYNHSSGRVQPLLAPAERAALDALRAVLAEEAGVQLDPDYRYAVRAYRVDAAGRRRALRPATVGAALERSGAVEQLQAITGEAQTDFVVRGQDKGTGLRVLLAELGVDSAAGKPLALAVGDTLADLPMLTIAARPYTPGHADGQLRRAGVNVLRQPYQAGLARAVAQLLGHHPGGCPICQLPPLPADARRLGMILAAQEAGTWGMLRSALGLAADLGRARLRSVGRPAREER
jgi:hydroxymethylpyrimidine pyrophosphatase-like HAD family hydrolase